MVDLFAWIIKVLIIIGAIIGGIFFEAYVPLELQSNHSSLIKFIIGASISIIVTSIVLGPFLILLDIRETLRLIEKKCSPLNQKLKLGYK